MNQEVIVIVLHEFADWEGAFIAPALNGGVEPGRARYKIKTLSLTTEPVKSIGGMNLLPDYDVHTLPDEYAGLILIGGMSWFIPEARQLVSLVEKAIKENKLVAGICNASVFLGMNGFLNNVRHTSNGLEYLKNYAGERYTGDKNYLNEQAVRDGNIVTANGTGYLEFCREILYALNADTEQKIDGLYKFNKLGFCELSKQT